MGHHHRFDRRVSFFPRCSLGHRPSLWNSTGKRQISSVRRILRRVGTGLSRIVGSIAVDISLPPRHRSASSPSRSTVLEYLHPPVVERCHLEISFDGNVSSRSDQRLLRFVRSTLVESSVGIDRSSVDRSETD